MNHITFADILSVIYIYISVRWSIYIIIIIIIMFESSILYTHESLYMNLYTHESYLYIHESLYT